MSGYLQHLIMKSSPPNIDTQTAAAPDWGDEKEFK